MMFILAIAFAQSVPQLNLKHQILMKVDATIFLQPNEKALMGKGPDTRWIIDETGTYVFSRANRFNIKTGHSAAFGSVAPYSGPTQRPSGFGRIRSRWTVPAYPDLDKYRLQETMDVYYSSTGGDLWLKTQNWRYARGGDGIGRMLLSRPDGGFNAAMNNSVSYLNFEFAMGTDGKSYAVIRHPYDSYKPSKAPGHWPPASKEGDILLGGFPEGKTRAVRLPGALWPDKKPRLIPWHLDVSRRALLGNATIKSEQRIIILDVSSEVATFKTVSLPVQKRSSDGVYFKSFPTGAWLTRRHGNILLQITDSSEESSRSPRSLWLYNMRTSKWHKVGDYRMYAWSGSNRLFLVGGEKYTDPAWLIRIED